MGGNAFPTPAARLPQDIYDAFQAYILPRLASTGYFSDMRVPRHLKEKVEHGDLDVTCAYQGPRPSGEEEWVEPTSSIPLPTSSDPIKEKDIGNETDVKASLADCRAPVQSAEASTAQPVDNQAPSIAPVQTQGYIRIMGGKNPNPDHVQSIRDLCASVMAATNATAWRRRTDIVSFKIPARILGVEGNHFYQFDLALVPPENLEFEAFIASYSSTTLIVGRMLVQLSRSFCLHMGDLALRHPAYVGVPPIELVLTRDPKDFCDWFGLNWEAWCAGFDTEQDFWRWLTTVDEGTDSADSELDKDKDKGKDGSTQEHGHDQKRSPAARALRRMAARQRDKTYGNSNSKTAVRAEPVSRFYKWLKNESDWAKYHQRAQAHAQAQAIDDPQRNQDKIVAEGHGQSHNKDEVISAEAKKNKPTSPTLPVPSPSPATPLLSSRLAATPTLLPSTSSTVPTSNTPNPFIDPSRPTPLDWRVKEALEHWGKMDEYAILLEVAKEKALFIATRQKEKELRRIAAATSTAGNTTGSGIGSPVIMPKTPDTPGFDIPAHVVIAQVQSDGGPEVATSPVDINKNGGESVKNEVITGKEA